MSTLPVWRAAPPAIKNALAAYEARKLKDGGKTTSAPALKRIWDDVLVSVEADERALAQSRLVLRFSWEMVDASLIRELLAATYKADKQLVDAGKVLCLTDKILRQNAVRVLGRPPNVRHMESHGASLIPPAGSDAWVAPGQLRKVFRNLDLLNGAPGSLNPYARSGNHS